MNYKLVSFERNMDKRYVILPPPQKKKLITLCCYKVDNKWKTESNLV